MPKCQECGEIVGASEIENGICNSCREKGVKSEKVATEQPRVIEREVVYVEKKGSPGLIAGIIASVMAVLGIFTLGFVFVPIAALIALIGSIIAIKNGSGSGIGVNLLAWVLVVVGFSTSPVLWGMLGLGAAVATQPYDYSSSITTTSRTAVESVPEDAMSVNIHDILSAYEQNEVAADNQYKGKIIEVKGTVTDIKKDLLDNLYITLGRPYSDEFREFQAFFDDSMNDRLGQLRKGESLTVICRVKGLMMNVIAEDCKIKDSSYTASQPTTYTSTIPVTTEVTPVQPVTSTSTATTTTETDQEELQRLRAEKADREKAEMRAELERLRAEKAARNIQPPVQQTTNPALTHSQGNSNSRRHNYPYVCYNSKYITGGNAVYNGCIRASSKCQNMGKHHFGKYPNDKKTHAAFIRCISSNPKFVDTQGL